MKLWPTLVFLRDGIEQARVIRPTDLDDIEAALARIDPAPDKSDQFGDVRRCSERSVKAF